MAAKNQACAEHHKQAVRASHKILKLVEKEMSSIEICGLETKLSFKFGNCGCVLGVRPKKAKKS